MSLKILYHNEILLRTLSERIVPGYIWNFIICQKLMRPIQTRQFLNSRHIIRRLLLEQELANDGE